MPLQWPAQSPSLRFDMSDRALWVGWPPEVLGVAALITAMSGCAVGPDFRAPRTPETSGYVSERLPDSTEATGAVGEASQHFHFGRDLSGQWWELFGSSQLSTLIEEAMASYPDVIAQQAALKAARDNVRAESGIFLPQMQGATN